jgi:hypothetical protein
MHIQRKQKRLALINISPFTRSKGIVQRAAPNAFLGERWVRTKVSSILTRKWLVR